jgi:hypothetical protein
MDIIDKLLKVYKFKEELKDTPGTQINSPKVGRIRPHLVLHQAFTSKYQLCLLTWQNLRSSSRRSGSPA